MIVFRYIVMTCILRINGKTLDIQALLDTLEIEPYQWWKKGDLLSNDGLRTGTFKYSGAKFDVSEADMDKFDLQLEDAIFFLTKNKADISKIVTFTGVEDVILDFAIAIGDTFTHTDKLSPNFLGIVGNLGISVTLSHYPTCDDEDDDSEV